ncbi:hypothetical protein AMELA_G00256240 [Ameiurus melas]|uniref:Uncharacterized protein n=1 Tax=Ameiurus melas TaxID=219545 RepID=A0A7J5ZRK3_AMEME|nr:hypothetical protein AMELA_G00256240 [Ameiurus melas]
MFSPCIRGFLRVLPFPQSKDMRCRLNVCVIMPCDELATCPGCPLIVPWNKLQAPLCTLSATKAGPSSSSPGPSSAKASQGSALSAQFCQPDHKDCLFREFRKLCAMVAKKSSYNAKTEIIKDFLRKGSAGDKFKGDLYLTVKLLLPGVVKSVYNLNDKQIVKLFSRILNCNQDEMVRDLTQGDVSETVRMFFEASTSFPPSTKSLLTIQEVDASLTRLAQLTKEDEQQAELEDIAKKCTGNDLKCYIRLVKHDLKINSGAKHVLDALDPNAYDAFKASRNLGDVIDRVLRNQEEASNGGGPRKHLSVEATLMTPVQPMLGAYEPGKRHWLKVKKDYLNEGAMADTADLVVLGAQKPSADPELFTPILDVNCAEDRNRDEYWFLCPHAGHFKCKWTNIVIEMESKGEVLYRIVSWDCHLLNGLPPKEPAGPLYNIDSPEGCIRRLHFPHCETGMLTFH